MEQSVQPWVHRVRALTPLIPEALGNPVDPMSGERLLAWGVALGRVLSYEAALEAASETTDVREDVGGALALLPDVMQRGLLPSVDDVKTALDALRVRAQQLALTTDLPQRHQTLAERLADPGDAEAVIARWELIEKADDQLCLLALYRECGQSIPTSALQPVLRFASELTRGLDDATRWRLEAVVERACNERSLWTDPIRWPLYTVLADVTQRPWALTWFTENQEIPARTTP